MKWFKHLTASGHDPDIGAFMDEFGPLGYFLFFRTIEIMSTEFDIESPGKNKFNFQWFLSQFPRKIGKKKVKSFLISAQKKRRIFFKINGADITLNCPKLKDLTDEYTVKLIAKKSGVNQEQVRSESEKTPSHRIRSKNKNLSKDKCTDIDFTLTNLLINGILKNDSKAKVPKKETEQYFNWVNQARLMREADDRTPQEIEGLIRFSQEDEFWQSNILSMGKLREKATQLLLKARRFKPDETGKAPLREKNSEEEKRSTLIEKKRSKLYEKHKSDLDNADTLDKKKDIEALIATQVATYSRQLEGEL